jgi:hypothetical protein
MPLARPYALGNASAVSPPCNLRRRIVLAADGIVPTSPLLVEGLPHLFLWAAQTVGAVAATMEWQWSARSVTDIALAAPNDDWQPLFHTAVTVLTPPAAGVAIPVYYERAAFSAKRIRLRLTRSPGVPTTVEVYYGGTV